MLRSGVWAAVATIGLAGPATAQVTYTWTGGTNNNWANSGNWFPLVVPNATNAIAAFNLGSSYTVAVTDGVTTNSHLYDVLALQFKSGQTGNVTLGTATSPVNGGPRITLNPGTGADGSIPANNGNTTIYVDAASGDHTIQVGVRLGGTGTSHVWEVQTGRTLTLTAAAELSTSNGGASSNSLTKVGGGTLVLNNSSNFSPGNQFTGGLTINGGLVQANGNSFPTGTGTVTVNSGSTFGGRGTVQVGATNSVTVNSGGTLTAGTSAGAPTLTIGGTGTDALIVNAGATYRAQLYGPAGTVVSNVTVNSGQVTFDSAALLKLDVGVISNDMTAITNLRNGGARVYTVLAANEDQTATINLQASNFSVINLGQFDPSEFSYGGTTFDANSGITSVLVNFNPVPEPGAALAVATAGVLLARRRRQGLEAGARKGDATTV